MSFRNGSQESKCLRELQERERYSVVKDIIPQVIMNLHEMDKLLEEEI